MSSCWRLLSLRVGRARSGPRDQPTAIEKAAVQQAQFLDHNGFEKDEQGDPVHHGGVEKAVHHYAAEHYPVWQEELASLPVCNMRIGGFGENISTLGLNESNIAIGDIFELGEALIQVSQPRQPCWKLNHRFNVPDMALQVQTKGRTGWYYRVLQAGWVRPDDVLNRIARPQSDWLLVRVLRALYDRQLEQSELEALANLPELSPRLRQLASRRLGSHAVEDWSRRLQGA